MKLSDFLAKELSFRKAKNLGYSIRAFSRDLGLSPSFTSQLLKDKAKLSEKKALKVVKNLKFSQEKSRFFINLVKLHNIVDETEYRNVQLEIENNKDLVFQIEKISEAHFRSISKWYVGAVMALIAKNEGRVNSKLISECFEVDEREVEELLKDLITMGLLKLEGHLYVKSSPWYMVTEVPSFYIQKYHRSHLEKAKKSITNQKMSERDLTGSTFLFDSKNLEDVKNLIKEFHNKIAIYALNLENSDSIYHMAIQFYRLDKS